MDLKSYRPSINAYDELFLAGARSRPGLAEVGKFLKKSSLRDLNRRRSDAELAIRSMGITFTVYSDGSNIDREWPFDIIPRTILKKEWDQVELGLKQRLQALNLFITDVYNDQKIIKDKIIPREILASSKDYREFCEGVTPIFGVWAHICGTDLIRDGDGTIYVLEDNLRVPSGVSYMLENRDRKSVV